MLLNTALAFFMLLFTSAIHTGVMLLVIKIIQTTDEHWNSYWKHMHMIRVSGVVVLMSIALLLEALAWAIMYLRLGAFETLEPALYFSTVTYTTLGYGDITLSPQWRLLGAYQSANGIIMFGWTTAIVIAGIQRNYFSKDK